MDSNTLITEIVDVSRDHFLWVLILRDNSMIGIEITSKENGIPPFTHEFRPDTLFNSEIRGGLITAIMKVMGETFRSQETKIVNYGPYPVTSVSKSYPSP